MKINEMEFKNDVEDFLHLKKLPPNISRINFGEEKQEQCSTYLCQSIIKMASEIFAKDIIDYSKNGGDLKKLTVKNVYENDNNVSTSSKSCDMCVGEKGDESE